MYTSTVFRLGTPRPHPNADNLHIFTILGYQVITNKDHNEGDIGIFFPPDGQVSEEFAEVNELIAEYNEDGTKANNGYMGKNRRVTAINLRGEKSQGLWMPVKSLTPFMDVSVTLEHGQEITEIGGHKFCQKYFTPATIRAMKGQRNGVRVRRETSMFHMHIDTKKLRQEIDKVPYGLHFIITEKVHGTSGRYGRSLEATTYPIWHWKRWFGLYKEEWVYLNGSRKVIFRNPEDYFGRFYGDEHFRYQAIDPLKNNLKKGETVYFELVGYVNGERLIMDPVNTDVLKDKTFKKKYGKTMTYTYGCKPDECKMIVYRISMTNVDGEEIDLTWEQTKRRCKELGVEHVKEFCKGVTAGRFLKLNDLYIVRRYDESDEPRMREGLLNICEDLSTGESLYDLSHIREGVCLRVETGENIPSYYKYKSHEFLVLEGHTKGREDYVDMEEIS